MQKKKLLLIVYAFPPVSAPESFLSAKTLGNLPGFEVDVLCAAPYPGFLGEDPTLNEYVSSRFSKIVRLPPPLWLQWVLKIPILAQRFLDFSLFPDRAVYLNRTALRCLLSWDLNSYHALITWSQFHSAHLLGLKIKEHFPSLRWIAHFSDPWVDNPFNHLKLFTRSIYRSMESKIIHAADTLVFSSELTVNLVMRKYNHKMLCKTKVIEHAFDPVLFDSSIDEVETKSEGDRSRIHFRYIGNFYGNRTPLPLLRALRLLHQNSPNLLQHTTFELIGHSKVGFLDSREMRRLLSSLPTGLVIQRTPVNYLTSLKLMKSSDILLVIDAPAQYSVFLPSKLVDYLGSGRPILGITSPGTSANLIKRIGGCVVNPRDPQEIASALLNMVQFLKKDTGLSAVYQKVQQEYSVVAISERVNELFN